MVLALLLNSAQAADLVLSLSTGEGLSESWSQPHNDAVTKQFGPLEGRGKRRVSYTVTLMPSVYDPLAMGFETRVSVCRTWSKKGKGDRDCLEDLVIVRSEAEGPVTMGGKIKGSDKFELNVSIYYSGAPPGTPVSPMEEEEAPVEEGPSALENIARDIVEGLGSTGSEDPPRDDEDNE